MYRRAGPRSSQRRHSRASAENLVHQTDASSPQILCFLYRNSSWYGDSYKLWYEVLVSRWKLMALDACQLLTHVLPDLVSFSTTTWIRQASALHPDLTPNTVYGKDDLYPRLLNYTSHVNIFFFCKRQFFLVFKIQGVLDFLARTMEYQP